MFGRSCVCRVQLILHRCSVQVYISLHSQQHVRTVGTELNRRFYKIKRRGVLPPYKFLCILFLVSTTVLQDTTVI